MLVGEHFLSIPANILQSWNGADSNAGLSHHIERYVDALRSFFLLLSMHPRHRLAAAVWEQLARHSTLTSLALLLQRTAHEGQSDAQAKLVSGVNDILWPCARDAPVSTPAAAQAYHRHRDQVLDSGPCQLLAIEAMLLYSTRAEAHVHGRHARATAGPAQVQAPLFRHQSAGL